MEVLKALLFLALLVGIGVINYKNIRGTARRLIKQCMEDR